MFIKILLCGLKAGILKDSVGTERSKKAQVTFSTSIFGKCVLRN